MIIARFQESFSQKSMELDYLAFRPRNMRATFCTVQVSDTGPLLPAGGYLYASRFDRHFSVMKFEVVPGR
jgi:hypothetical protein